MQLPPLDARGRFAAELRQAGMLPRLFAKALDLLPMGLVLALTVLVDVPTLGLLGLLAFCLLDWVGSPGKWLLRLRVVDLQGQPVGPSSALKRNAMFVVAPMLQVAIWAGWLGSPRTWDQISVFCVGGALLIGELVGLLLQRESRRWGDVFAGTRVVER
jgi:uncharacterized RDD family membrane protein YckC